jgi:hypothetical protein
MKLEDTQKAINSSLNYLKKSQKIEKDEDLNE